MLDWELAIEARDRLRRRDARYRIVLEVPMIGEIDDLISQT